MSCHDANGELPTRRPSQEHGIGPPIDPHALLFKTVGPDRCLVVDYDGRQSLARGAGLARGREVADGSKCLIDILR